jgi:heptosyltransferase-2
MDQRILIVAPAWVGDAILSEPLIALLREPYSVPIVDVLAPAWCAPVYARMRGIRRVIENPLAHGTLDLKTRRTLARSLREENYTRAIRAADVVEIGVGAAGSRRSRDAPATSAKRAMRC